MFSHLLCSVLIEAMATNDGEGALGEQGSLRPRLHVVEIHFGLLAYKECKRLTRFFEQIDH